MRRGLRWERHFFKKLFLRRDFKEKWWRNDILRQDWRSSYAKKFLLNIRVTVFYYKSTGCTYKQFQGKKKKVKIPKCFEHYIWVSVDLSWHISYSFYVMRTRLLFLCSEIPVYLLRLDLQFLKCWFGMELLQNILTWFKNQVNYVILLDNFLWHFDFANLFQAVSV